MIPAAQKGFLGSLLDRFSGNRPTSGTPLPPQDVEVQNAAKRTFETVDATQNEPSLSEQIRLKSFMNQALVKDIAKWLEQPRDGENSELVEAILLNVAKGGFNHWQEGDEAIVSFLRQLRKDVGDAKFAQLLREMPQGKIAAACQKLLIEMEEVEEPDLNELRVGLSYLVASNFNEVGKEKILELTRTLYKQFYIDSEVKDLEIAFEANFFYAMAGECVLDISAPLTNEMLLRFYTNPYRDCLFSSGIFRRYLLTLVVKPEVVETLFTLPRWRTILYNILATIPPFEDDVISFSLLEPIKRELLQKMVARAVQQDREALNKPGISLPSIELQAILLRSCAIPDFPQYWNEGIPFQGIITPYQFQMLKKVWTGCSKLDPTKIVRGATLLFDMKDFTSVDRVFLHRFFPDLVACPKLQIEKIEQVTDWTARVPLVAAIPGLANELSVEDFLELITPESNRDYPTTSSAFSMALELLEKRIVDKGERDPRYAELLFALFSRHSYGYKRPQEFWDRFNRIIDVYPAILSSPKAYLYMYAVFQVFPNQYWSLMSDAVETLHLLAQVSKQNDMSSHLETIKRLITPSGPASLGIDFQLPAEQKYRGLNAMKVLDALLGTQMYPFHSNRTHFDTKELPGSSSDLI